MWSSWLNNSTIPALEQSVAFAQRRHTILAGNLANLDVPGYKTRDLSLTDFQETLKAAVTQPVAESSNYPFASSPATAENAMEKVRDVSRQILFHDGSDVSLEEQVTEISKNQGMHNMAIALMHSQFQTLQVAIGESVNV